jgi:hypothetical protein
MTDKEIAALLGFCSQWWPNWRPPEDVRTMILGWRSLLSDIEFDAGYAALSEHATAGSEFPPPVGVIRRRAFELTVPEGSAPPVDEAWGEVGREIHRVGHFVPSEGEPDRLPSFSHPAITAVVNALTWKSLCESTNEVADRAHFARMYAERVRSYVDVAARTELAQQVRMRALTEAEDEPKRIGDNVRALVRPE